MKWDDPEIEKIAVVDNGNHGEPDNRRLRPSRVSNETYGIIKSFSLTSLPVYFETKDIPALSSILSRIKTLHAFIEFSKQHSILWTWSSSIDLLMIKMNDEQTEEMAIGQR